MKILAIRLKNLASLAGPFELDFTAEPLAIAGLFAITGPTGAGKSTLLDALCLALFGAIPRLNNIGQSKVPEIDGEIGTSDPRNLLRRGTGSGYAEVDFVGIDGRRYRARWETNRARDNASKKLQASRQTLTDLDSEQILSSQNKTEYKTLLEARLGMNFRSESRPGQRQQKAAGQPPDPDRPGQRANPQQPEQDRIQNPARSPAGHELPIGIAPGTTPAKSCRPAARP